MRLLRKPLTSRVRLYQNPLVIAILFAGAVVQSKADIYTIGARDASMQIDLASGISQWTIDGVNQLNQQSFYYSVGSGAANSIYTLGLLSAPTITTNLSKGNNYLTHFRFGGAFDLRRAISAANDSSVIGIPF